jgi:hypothetical protein
VGRLEILGQLPKIQLAKKFPFDNFRFGLTFWRFAISPNIMQTHIISPTLCQHQHDLFSKYVV